ncbi:CopG family transcriptional regulator [Aphanothece hegewaldii CCALA 016]|uniref:CopG family transcriptional regulator n=1 Tax=Aphanothece hegewaldii CCALA 016 TaxID=2107694 RepID=A0A2T1M220_9CHRO|nr:CopG family transcriptional regulator [Aphanothece hegewaldii]PSF38752.1 CopG family transcriptional regulator [Aphanothece hegewaldii CCALA 016]
MKQKIAVTLDEDLISFLDKMAKGNRSDYINNLLTQQRKLILESEIIAALQEDLEDPNYQQEIKEWDIVVGDGIDAER